MPRNSNCCVAASKPLSLDNLKSMPRSFAKVSMRIPAYLIYACVGAAIRISSI